MTGRTRILVIGVGSIGERHVRCLAATGRAEVSICETLAERRERVADEYHVVRAYESLDHALRHERQFDVAFVCVPAQLHVPFALRLAQAGKHLLIEKPLSTSEHHLPQLRQLLRRKELVAGVAYVYRHHPALQSMRQALLDGRIGAPVELVAVGGQHFPTYRPAYAEIYYRDRQTGGGAVQDALTHIINAAEWMVGRASRLAADAAHLVLPDVTVEDTVHVIARHGGAHDRVLACYTLNQHQAPNEVTITVHGTRGSARFEMHANRWRWMTDPGGEWRDEPAPALQRDDLFVAQARDFLDAVAQRRRPACSIAEAWQTLRVNLAVLAAAESGCWAHVAADERGEALAED